MEASATLRQVVWENLFNKVTFEKRFKGDTKMNPGDSQWNSTQDKRIMASAKAQGPGVSEE